VVEGQRELFEDVPGCVGIPPDDAEAIADAIESLLARRSEWPRLGADNRRHVVVNYDMRGWAQRMRELYLELPRG
jgi:glycosyltransferase involved in cell wall biosynthesis